MSKYTIDKNAQFFKDLSNDSSNVNRGIYNLICCKRDLKLYVKGIKPHRNWKITDVKRYFGIKGNSQNILKQLTLLDETFLGKE